MSKKALLMILDGWGIGDQGKDDVIFNTPTPYWDSLLAAYPHSELQASGENTRRPQRPSSFSSGQLRGGYSAAPSCRAASSCSGWAWISPTAMFPPAYTMPASFQPRQSSSAL